MKLYGSNYSPGWRVLKHLDVSSLPHRRCWVHYIGFSWSQTIQTAFLTASCDFSDIFGGWWFLINTQLLHICFHLALQWKKLFEKRNELSPEKDMQFSFWTTSYSDRKDPMFQTFVEELFKRRAIHILATLNLNRGRNIHCSRAISIQYTNHIHKKTLWKNQVEKTTGWLH